MKSLVRRDSASADPVKDAALLSLERVLDPLLGLMFEAGLTVQEFNKLARERAVKIAITRVLKENGRPSNSRVSIVTGLPRSEVTKILKSLDSIERPKPGLHPARRILAAWHDDPRFLAPNGVPEDLPIFGRRRSFEGLVQKYGGGIPVRAMLDELIQLNAVEQIQEQKVRAKARVPISTGLSARSMIAIGDRARDLLVTLAHNVRLKGSPHFEATAVLDDSEIDKVSLIRREIAEQGANFINTATSLLNRSKAKGNSKSASRDNVCRLGVSVFYFEEELADGNAVGTLKTIGRRKNLRRKTRKDNSSRETT